MAAKRISFEKFRRSIHSLSSSSTTTTTTTTTTTEIENVDISDSSELDSIPTVVTNDDDDDYHQRRPGFNTESDEDDENSGNDTIIEDPKPSPSSSSFEVPKSNMIKCFNRAQSLLQRRKRWLRNRGIIKTVPIQAQFLETLLDEFKSSNLNFVQCDSRLLSRQNQSPYMRLILISDLFEEFDKFFVPVEILETISVISGTKEEGKNAIPITIPTKLILVYHWLPFPKSLWTKDSIFNIHPDWLLLKLDDDNDDSLLCNGRLLPPGKFHHFILNGFNISKEN